MVRRILTVFGGVLIMAAGGGLWVGLQHLKTLQSPGTVLGEQTTISAFWQGKHLLLTGSGNDQLIAWDAAAGLRPVSGLRGPVVAAAQSTDGKILVAVHRAGDTKTLWVYEEGENPRFLFATIGDVSNVQFSERGTMVSYQESRPEFSGVSLYLADLRNGEIQRVTTNTLASTWYGKGEAVLSLDTHQQVWYHPLQLSGRLGPPELLISSLSTPAVLKSSGDLVFVQKELDGVTVKTFNLATREQRLLGLVPVQPFDGVADLLVAPSGAQALFRTPPAAGQQNGDVWLVNLQSGAATKLPFPTRYAIWESDDAVLFERAIGADVTIGRYSLSDAIVRDIMNTGVNTIVL